MEVLPKAPSFPFPVYYWLFLSSYSFPTNMLPSQTLDVFTKDFHAVIHKVQLLPALAAQSTLFSPIHPDTIDICFPDWPQSEFPDDNIWVETCWRSPFLPCGSSLHRRPFHLKADTLYWPVLKLKTQLSVNISKIPSPLVFFRLWPESSGLWLHWLRLSTRMKWHSRYTDMLISYYIHLSIHPVSQCLTYFRHCSEVWGFSSGL